MLKTPLVIAGSVRVGGGAPLALIAGPCIIESEAATLRIAATLATFARRHKVPLVFKASFDKANRTSVHSFRGPGLGEGLRTLALVRRETGLPVLTDIHEAGQAAIVAEVADVLQIPALLARQTDLLAAAGRTGRTVNIKKGQFMAPRDMAHAVDKVRAAGGRQVLVTERGVSFGYHNLVVDMRALPQLAALPAAVVFDGSHSVQLPSAGSLSGPVPTRHRTSGRSTDSVAASGGQREFIPTLVRAACAVGVDALFIEVHPHPAKAKSDGPNAWPLGKLGDLWRMALDADRTGRRWR